MNIGINISKKFTFFSYTQVIIQELINKGGENAGNNKI